MKTIGIFIWLFVYYPVQDCSIFESVDEILSEQLSLRSTVFRGAVYYYDVQAVSWFQV